MKLGPVTKLDKGNTLTSKNFDDGVILFFPIYGQFAVIPKPDSGHMFYRTYIFINSNLLSYRT